MHIFVIISIQVKSDNTKNKNNLFDCYDSFKHTLSWKFKLKAVKKKLLQYLFD